MDCSTAGPFVSLLYDNQVPPEALRHIANCASCQSRFDEYAAITSELRKLGTEDPSAVVPYAPILGGREGWLIALSRAVYVPRLVAGVFIIALIVASAGWFRVAAQGKMIPYFAFTIAYPSQGTEARTQLLSEGSIGRSELNKATQGGFLPLAYKVRVLRIMADAVVLDIRIKRFPESENPLDSGEAGKALDELGLRTVTYFPGQKMTMAVDDGDPAVLSGSVIYQREKTAPFDCCGSQVPDPKESGASK